MATLLVTGGAGFIGSNLVRRILDTTRHQVVVVDKLTYASNRHGVSDLFANPRARLVRADVADRAAIARVFAEHRPAAVLHLAAETHVDRSIDSSSRFVETNVCGTVALLEESRRLYQELDGAARETFRFLHVSTDEVYGSLAETGLFTETTPYAPNSPYAASKAASDHMVRAYHATYGLPALVTNCSNNYGPFQHAEKLIPLTILNALDARPLPIYGDGRNVRDWLHVDDHCSALLTVLDRARPGSTYNIGGGNERSNLALVDAICAALDDLAPASANPAMRASGVRRYQDLMTFVADRPGHDRRYAIDSSKLRRDIGWKPLHTFADGLRSTVRWYVEHRVWFDAVALGYDRERLGLGALPA